MYGMTEMIANHISCGCRATRPFLINAYGMLYEEIDASSLIKIDVEGNTSPFNALDYGVNRAGFVIHSAIHMAKPDMDCVAHTHTRPAWPSRPWNAGCCR